MANQATKTTGSAPSHLVFDKYRLLGLMNSGGMAELFLALQAGLEGFTKVVALKRVLPHLSESPEFVQMFLDEARLAARLDHPNIVRIYDFGESDNCYFMAMEYLPGEDLSRILHLARKVNQPVPFEIAALIVQAAAEGLHFAHELTDTYGEPLGLVHRDANPSNIIVTYYGAVKVVDFGIAKAMNDVGHTQAGQIKGKLAYLAPEQVTSERVDRRADLFCLGIVLWETLTGRKLFARESDMASAQAVVTMEVPPPSKHRADVPPELDALVLKALEKDSSKRFQSAGELQDALEEFFRGRTLRPSTKDVANWLEGLFGTARADAKRSIAQGRNLRTSISVVMKALDPALTGTSHGSDRLSPLARSPGGARALQPTQATPTQTHSPPPAASARRRTVQMLGLLASAATLIAAGNVLLGRWTQAPGVARAQDTQARAVPRGAQNSQARPATAQLAIDSEPAGAFIFIDGEPTGQFTPATLAGLNASQGVQVRLEKEGFQPAGETISLAPGETARRSLRLNPLSAEVHLRKLPAGARVVVDGSANTSSPDLLRLSPGVHVLQIKVAGQLVNTRTIDVKPGEQVVQF